MDPTNQSQIQSLHPWAEANGIKSEVTTQKNPNVNTISEIAKAAIPPFRSSYYFSSGRFSTDQLHPASLYSQILVFLEHENPHFSPELSHFIEGVKYNNMFAFVSSLSSKCLFDKSENKEFYTKNCYIRESTFEKIIHTFFIHASQKMQSVFFKDVINHDSKFYRTTFFLLHATINALPENLTQLSLKETRITDQQLKLILSRLKNLQVLDLSGCKELTDVGLKMLFEKDMPALTTLLLDDIPALPEETRNYLTNKIVQKSDF